MDADGAVATMNAKTRRASQGRERGERIERNLDPPEHSRRIVRGATASIELEERLNSTKRHPAAVRRHARMNSCQRSATPSNRSKLMAGERWSLAAATVSSNTRRSRAALRSPASIGRLGTGHIQQHSETGWTQGVAMHRFLIVIEKADNNFSAYSPDLPGCVATGATREETERLMYEAIQLHVEGLQEDNQPIPASTSYAEYVVVPA